MARWTQAWVCYQHTFFENAESTIKENTADFEVIWSEQMNIGEMQYYGAMSQILISKYMLVKSSKKKSSQKQQGKMTGKPQQADLRFCEVY